MKQYEGMFLIEPTTASKEWARVEEEIGRLIKKHGGQMVNLAKWGERKLSYPVKRSNRGTYVLAYFSADETRVHTIRADFQLSEVVMRTLITAHEGEIRKEPPKDFETAGLVSIRRVPDGDDRGTRSFGPPRF